MTLPIAADTFNITSTSTAGIFQGIGSLSAGAVTRLLLDYPATQQSQILDYLFKPNYGMALQILKVEIGSDADSSDGAEPSYNRTGSESVVTRGYEGWLIQQAKTRNPNIKIYALQWGTPGWSGNAAMSGCTGSFWSTNNITYMVGWIQAMETTYGYNIDYIGMWNESSTYCIPWVKALYTAIQAASLSTQIIAADQLNNWQIATDGAGDSVLFADVSAYGVHYPAYNSTPTAKSSGKILWDAEDGPWCGTWAECGDNRNYAQLINRSFISGGMTGFITWAIVGSYYFNLTLPNAGLIAANTPWSGAYTVQPNAWQLSHTTQFAQPGWSYLAGATTLSTTGSCVPFLSTNGTDYSFVCETFGASANGSVLVNLSGALSTGTVYVWESSSTAQFVQVGTITPSAGSWTYSGMVPNASYSFTTTTGQAKGSAAGLSGSSFPFPYQYNFGSYTVGSSAAYLSDLVGSFPVTACITGRTGNCIQQVVVTQPIAWPSAGGYHPLSLAGDVTWTDYTVSSDVLLGSSGNISIYGRIGTVPQQGSFAPGYNLNVTSGGAWGIYTNGSNTIASGSLGSFGTNTWHNLKLSFVGTTITAYIDGTQVGSATDSTYSVGMIGIGVGGWYVGQFDNLQICTTGGVCVVAPVGSIISNTTLGGNVVIK